MEPTSNDERDLNLDLSDLDEDDFTSSTQTNRDYLDSMWSGYGFSRGSRDAREDDEISRDTIIAHGMVQSFVNAFARDGRYEVGFSDATETASTDVKARRIIISPAPIADPTIDAQRAGKILTSLACHEITHPRYNSHLITAVENTFPGNLNAHTLSNLLQDIGGERKFERDYPGYAGIFQAGWIDYVGETNARKHGAAAAEVSLDRQIDLAISATRFSKFADWSDVRIATERDWWIDWSEKYADTLIAKTHVAGIREALAHIVANRRQQQQSQPEPQPSQDGQGGKANESIDDDSAPQTPSQGSGPAGESDDEDEDSAGQSASAADEANEADDEQSAGGAGEESDDDATDQSAGAGDDASDAGEPGGQSADGNNQGRTPADLTDNEINEESREEPRATRGTCAEDNVDQAANDNGVTHRDINDLRYRAEQTVQNQRYVESDGHGNLVEVSRSLKGIASGRSEIFGDSVASRYIRNAILRSRSGHTKIAGHQKHGRLDGFGLARVSYGDVRVFEKRSDPGPGKYNVWVMVDVSGSMAGYQMTEAAKVALAMAAASTGTPTVHLGIYAWSSPFRGTYSNAAGVARVWQTGDSLSEIARIGGLRNGGTPDAAVLGWASRRIRKETPAGTTPAIIIVSDGAGDFAMTDRVAEARAAGVQVYSVSFGSFFTASQQEQRFGRGNFVPYARSIAATAKPLADLFVRITSGKAQPTR